MISDYTEVIPPDKHPHDGITFKIPPVHRYNIRERRLKGYNLMENDVTKTFPPIQMPTPAPNNTAVHQT